VTTLTHEPLAWLDRTVYPFESHWFELPMGRMHYIDEGSGPPVVFVHGTPTWSFLYRHAIQALSGQHRCIAPDQLGFGLSDKPIGWGYTPREHADNLARLIAQLGLREVVLVVHDFGGPIGLSYAIEHPENVAGLVILNSWMWDMRGENPSTERMMRLLGGPLGRYLYTRWNLSARVLLPQLWGNRSALTPAIHQHYTAPFATPRERYATWVLARELLASGPWYDSLWQRREALADKPALLVWGMRDPAFGAAQLARWSALLPHARVERLPEVGHFVPEEAPEQFVAALRSFLK
jgi:haloalkane dehalogenase